MKFPATEPVNLKKLADTDKEPTVM